MMKPHLSHLQRVFQKVGLDEVIPHDLSQASDAELQTPFAKFLSIAECHGELGISENFDPTTLPSVPFELGDRPSSFEPFMTMTTDESTPFWSRDLTSPSFFTKPPLDSDDFLGCRLFFSCVADYVEHGARTVIFQNKEEVPALYLHIKELRLLGTDESENLTKVLMQVEYCLYENSQDLMSVLKTLAEQSPRVYHKHCGTTGQIYFVHQVLQAHERLLDRTFISKHDKEWSPKHNFNIRPSFIVPLRTIFEGDYRQLRWGPKTEEILNEIKSTVIQASNNRASCAVCDQTNVKMKLCPCRSISYCTQKCQESDWQSHKKTCRLLSSRGTSTSKTEYDLMVIERIESKNVGMQNSNQKGL